MIFDFPLGFSCKSCLITFRVADGIPETDVCPLFYIERVYILPIQMSDTFQVNLQPTQIN